MLYLDFIFIILLQSLAVISNRFTLTYVRGIQGGSLQAQASERMSREHLYKKNKNFPMLYDLFYSVGNIALLITPYALPALVFLKFGWGFFFISIVFLIIAAVLSPFTIMLIADKWIFYKITRWKFPFDISLGFITTVMYLHHF